ncbi:MAG: hypothetical protein OEW15_18745 [Nitrospirota bacterium]|nr:hypothetical protein [Nitrospirota bacterium]
MKRAWIFILIAGFIITSLGMVIAADKDKVFYVCNCKDDCHCNSISKEPGKCTCGTELMGTHVLAIEKDVAKFCRCGAECTCELSKTDPAKCGCGKPVKVVSLKGKYVCACGGDCQCNTISDKPGKCGCGKEMKQI